MTQLNKVIHACAKLLAILMIAGIVFSAVSFLGDLSFFFSSEKEYVTEKSLTAEGVMSLDVDLEVAELIIENGDILHAETNGNEISLSKDGSTLKIKERSSMKKQKGTKVILTVPSLAIFQDVDISIGAGKLSADELSAVSFSLDLGAGDVEINKLNASSRADIDCGAGNLDVEYGSISNLDLEVGVGDVDLRAAIFGESEIECGLGDLTLTLINGKKLNRIACDVGIGNFKIDGEKIKDNTVINHGANSIDINGGVGNVTVIFADQNGETTKESE